MEGSTISYIYLVFTCLLSFAVALIGVGPFIDYLRKKFIGQYIREDGPQEHHSKQGTPTMGGLIILLAILIPCLLVLFLIKQLTIVSLVLLLIVVAFCLLGFSDDYFKVMKKHNKGLTGWSKLIFQILLALIVVSYVFFFEGVSTLSLFGLMDINLGILFIPFGLFVIVGTSNAVNLTDGLDGLASSISILAFLTLSFFLYKTGNFALSIVAISVVGACLGFFIFNRHPAKIFMGDAGSLMLGGTFGVLGVLGHLEFWLIPLGIIFVIEALSVIIQVISFKSTGKRVFKMTPIHHHFELSGDKETLVVKKFFCVQLLFCVISIIAGYIWLF